VRLTYWLRLRMKGSLPLDFHLIQEAMTDLMKGLSAAAPMKTITAAHGKCDGLTLRDVLQGLLPEYRKLLSKTLHS
jgi:hypothetical protein